MNRRAFLRRGAWVLGGLVAGRPLRAAEPEARPVLRIALLTDVHYADKPTRINRHYRDSLVKLDEAVAVVNERGPDFAVHLGDLIDAGESLEEELEHLDAVETVMERLACRRRYVLGNHCVDGLTKEEFLGATGMEETHYAFEQKGLRFVVLDSCYRSDGRPYGRRNFDWTDANLPKGQLRWLEAELRSRDAPVVVFAHQRLDEAGPYSVRNAAEVRAVLESAGNVLAVFQGHDHKGDYAEVGGIHYCTQVALVEGPAPESSAYAVLSVFGDASLRIEGFRRQQDRPMPAASATSS